MDEPTSAPTRECPACGSRRARPSLTTRRGQDAFSYATCESCGTLLLSVFPSADELRRLYQRHEDLAPTVRDDRPTVHRRMSAPARWLRPHLWPPGPGRGRSILDIGCSSGRHLQDFFDRGWRVAGIDLDEAAIQHARELLPGGEFKAGDPLEAEFPSGSFEIIRLDNTLEHVPDPRALLKAARPWLTPEGRLIVYVPHGRSASIRVLGEHAVNIWPPFHLQLFSRRGLTRLLASAGFSTVTCWGYTPRGILASSLRQWRSGDVRTGAAPRPTAPGRVVESALWPLLALTRSEEELIGVGGG